MEGNKRTGSSGVVHALSRLAVQAEAQDHFNFVAVIEINTGEDIGERIKSFLENRANFPAWVKEHTCIGYILSGQGAVWWPLVDKSETMTLYKGSCHLVRLSGFYLIPIDGPIESGPHGGLTMAGASADASVFGGPVFGTLFADSPVQVTVHVSIIEEDPDWISLFQTK